jgi:hypothetical protein
LRILLQLLGLIAFFGGITIGIRWWRIWKTWRLVDGSVIDYASHGGEGDAPIVELTWKGRKFCFQSEVRSSRTARLPLGSYLPVLVNPSDDKMLDGRIGYIVLRPLGAIFAAVIAFSCAYKFY